MMIGFSRIGAGACTRGVQMPEPGVRETVRTHMLELTIQVTVRTQWERDHWVAGYSGYPQSIVRGETEEEALQLLTRFLNRQQWDLS